MNITSIGIINENNIPALLSASGSVTPSVNNTSFDEVLKSETSNQTKQASEKTYNLDEIFTEASETYGISKDILLAVGYTESGFNPGSTSSSGAMGIMQLMPSTAEALGVSNPYDPYENIMGGAKLLSQLQTLYDGDISLMAAAYNAGSGAVKKYGGIPPYESVKHYVEKIQTALASGITAPGNVTFSADSVANSNSSNTYEAAATTVSSKSSASSVSSYTGNSGLTIDGYTLEQYEILMEYYNNMLDIISSIGESGDDDDNDDSLTDLFKLAAAQSAGISSTDSTSSLTKTLEALSESGNVNRTTVSNAIAAYKSSYNLL